MVSLNSIGTQSKIGSLNSACTVDHEILMKNNSIFLLKY